MHKIFERRWVGQSNVPLVCSQGGAKDICCGESNLGHGNAGRSLIHGECIFQDMSQLAELMEAYCSRVALYRMHGATDAANDLTVLWRLFELQRVLVERLQEFLRGFKEQIAQLAPTVVRKRGHWDTSMRL